MRRLILEISEKELTKAGIELPPLAKIKSLELLYFLRQDAEEFAAITRIQFKDNASNLNELPKSELLIDAQIIEREKSGAYIAFIRSGPSLSSVLSYIGIEGGYLFPPLGIGGGKVKFSFLGSESQIREFMKKIDALGIKYHVVLLADADFSPVSVLNQLTQKQREVLISAYKLGYYDIPRRITSEELAKKLGLVDSTIVEHLRKAELRLIKHILEQ